jgi:chaperonin GroES
MPKIKPLGDHILIERLKAEEKTAGGIVLPDSAREKPAEGTVVGIGDGRLLDNGNRAPFQVASGDRVIFSSYAGSAVKFDGKEYLLMREEDVLAIVRQ